MADIYLAIGSNIEREKNIKSALKVLNQQVNITQQSSIYESAAYGFKGPPFYNLVVKFHSFLAIEDIIKLLQQIELNHGKSVNAQPFSSRTLDLDLLLYDDVIIANSFIELPHSDIVKYPFVLKPLAEIAGHKYHPVLLESYQALWEQFDKSLVELIPIHLKTSE